MPEPKGTILVVDDDQDMRALLCDELQERGYRIAAASDGREALKKLGEEDCAGSLEVGKQADILVLDAPNHEHLCYHFGVNLVETVVKNGKVVVEGGHRVR